MRTYIFAIFLAAISAPSAMGQSAEPERVYFGGAQWRVGVGEALVQRINGREALRLSSGRVWRDDLQLQDAVIEFDVYFDEAMGFIGPMFRAERDDHFEEFYFRSHLSNKPDTLQYTPVEHGLSAWQIFSDANAIAALPLQFGNWNRVKIVIEGDRADFYFNSEQPLLHVPDLKTNIARGRVGLRVSGPDGMFAYFSNFTARPLEAGERVVGVASASPAVPEGLIDSWLVSAPLTEDDIRSALQLDPDMTQGLHWQALKVERNGIANLARLAPADNGADTVFVRLALESTHRQMKELQFGYSDRVRMYLNGRRLYFGDAGWRVRDYRFLGTVGFFDSIGLDLQEGHNELLVAVSETFGGWAFAGAMSDREGVTLLGELPKR